MKKTQTKRILSLLLCIVMILSVWPVSVFAEGAYNEQTESALIEDAEIPTDEKYYENQEVVEGSEETTQAEEDSKNSDSNKDVSKETTQAEEDSEKSTLNKDDSKETSSTEDKVKESKEKPKNSFFQRRAIDGVVITAEAPAGVFPEGARLVCTAVKDENVSDAVDEAVNPLRKKGRRVNASYSFDIKVMYEGVEIEPNLEFGKVNISFDIEKKAGGGAQVDVYHVSGNENKNNLQAEKLVSEIEQITPESKTGQKPLPFEEGTSVNIEADGFSFYVVEFTYNNKTYVMEGGTVIPLTDVLNYLEIPNGKISNVEVSDDTLIYAGQLEDMKTGEKEWQLISLQPFSTEEWMKVTIDKKVYDITVTDGMTYEHVKLPDSTSTEVTLGKDGVTTTYRAEVGKSYEYKRTGHSQAGLTIAKGTSVVLYIPKGSSVTAQGGNASNENGGGAGILVPQNSRLIIVGQGTLNAIGGKPGDGGNGQDGADGWSDTAKKYNKMAAGKGGDGGKGGGGGGAAIGTNGARGGDGGKGRQMDDPMLLRQFYYYPDSQNRLVFETDGTTYYITGCDASSYWAGTAGNGGNGGDAASCGTVLTDGKVSISLEVLKGTGWNGSGKNGVSGKQGSGSISSYDKRVQQCGGGGSGGGGKGGFAGALLGAGGGGGYGGGGGGSGACWAHDRDQYNIPGANGGTADDGTGTERIDEWNRGYRKSDGEKEERWGGAGGRKGMSGNNPSSSSSVEEYNHDTPPTEVVRKFVLCNKDGSYDKNSKRVSFNYDGTPYDELDYGDYPIDDRKTEEYFEGYYTETDGKGIKVYDSNGKFTGNWLDSLALTAFSSNGEIKLIPHYGTAVASFEKEGLSYYYNDLQTAIDESEGNTVYVRCDIALKDALAIKKNDCKLDLQGHTLSCASGINLEYLIRLRAEGSLSLVGNAGGTIGNKGKGNRTAIYSHNGVGIKQIAPNYLIYAYSEDATGIGIGLYFLYGYDDGAVIQNTDSTSKIVGFGKQFGVGIMLDSPDEYKYTYSDIFPDSNNAMINGGSDEGICAALGIREGCTLNISNTTFPNLSSGWNENVPYTAKSNKMAMLYVGSDAELWLTKNVQCYGRTYGIVNDGGKVFISSKNVEVSGKGENKDGEGKTAGFGVYNKSGLISIDDGTIKGSGVAAGAVFLGNSEDTNCHIFGGRYIAPYESNGCIIRDGKDGQFSIIGGDYTHDLTGTGLINEELYLCIDMQNPDDECRYSVKKRIADSVIDKKDEIYDGEEHIGYTILEESMFVPDESRTIYEKADGTKLSGKPIEAGNYKVTVTGRIAGTEKAARETVEFEIIPRAALVAVDTDSCTITYGDKANIQGTISGLIGDDIGKGSVTLSYRDKETKEDQPIDAGEYEVYIKEFKVNDKVNANYQAQLDSAYTFKISPRQLQFDEEPTKAENLVYNAKGQELLSSSGNTSAGTIKYALGKADDDGAPADNQYSKDVPKGVDAGAYRVYARVFPPDGAKEENYIKSKIITRDVTIEKAEAKFKLTWPEENPTVSLSKNTVSAKLQCLYDSVTMKGVDLSGSVSYQEKDSDTPEVDEFVGVNNEDDLELKLAGMYGGTYKIRVTAVPNKNYKFSDGEDSKIVEQTLTMEKVNVRLEYFATLACENPIIYGSKLKDNPLTFTAKDGSSLGNGVLAWENDEMVVTEAGTYDFRYVPNAGTASSKTFFETTLKYEIEPGSIAPRPVDIEWANEVFYADGNKHVPTAAIKNLIDGDDCTVKEVIVYDSEGHECDAIGIGQYKAKVTAIEGSSSELYTLNGATNIEKQFEVVKFDPTVVVAKDVYAKVDGNPHSISFNVGIPEEVNVTYKYREKVENQWTEWTDSGATNPGFINAGYYEVQFTVTYEGRSHTGTGRAHLFEEDIPTFITYPQFANRTYTGENQSFLDNVPEISGSGTYKVMYMINNASGASVSTFSSNPPKAREAGNYIISYRIADADGNFMTDIFEPVTVTMAKALVEYTAPKLKKNEYSVRINNGDIEFVEAGVITGGRIEYSYTGGRDAYGDRDGYSVSTPYSERIPKESERGKYIVKYRIVPDRNHYVDTEDIEEKTLGEVVIRHFATFATPKAKQNLEYSGTAQELIIPGDEEQLEGGIMKYRLSGEQYASDIPTAIEPGDYSVYYIIEPFTEDYYVGKVISPEKQKIDVTISPQTVEIDELIFSKVYDGTTRVNASTEYEDTYGNKFTVNVSGVTDSPNVTEENQPTKINNAIISIASETDAGHYYLQVEAAYVNITPKEAKLLWDNTVHNYNGEEKKPYAWVSNRWPNDTVTVTLSGSQIKANAIDGKREAGKDVYIATATALSNKNYKLVNSPSREFFINRVAGVVKSAPKAIEGIKYDKTAHNLVTEGSSDDGTFEYSLDGGKTWSENIPKGTNVGKYNVIWKLKGDENHLDSEPSEPITISISKGVVEVIEEPKANEGLIYNGTYYATAIIGGKVKEGHGKIEYLNSHNMWSEFLPAIKNAGEHTVWWRVAENENYSGTEPKAITVTIEPKPIELIWENVRKKYTGEALFPTVTVSGIHKSDTCGVETSCEKPTIDVGEYTIKATLTGADAYNYQPINDSCQFTIEKVTATAIAPQIRNNLTYNGMGQQLIDEGTTSDGEIMYSLDGNTWQNYVLYGKHAGSYSVYWYVKGDDNHTDSPISVLEDKAVISQKTATLEWEEKEFFYSGSSYCPTAKVTNLEEGDACNVSVEGAAVNAGIHTAYATYLDNLDYKLPPECTHEFKIEKVAPIVYTPSVVENLIYTGSPLVLITPGIAIGGTMEYKCGENGEWTQDFKDITGINAGNYEIFTRVKGDMNHTDYPLSEEPEEENLTKNLINDSNENSMLTLPANEETASYKTATIFAAPAYLITIPTAVDSLIYQKGVSQQLVSGGQSSTRIIEYSFDGINWSQDVPCGENAGSYSVYCRAGADENHTPSEAVVISNTMISKAVPDTTKVKASNITYGENLENSIISGAAEGDTVEWKNPFIVPGSKGGTAFNAIYTPADTDNYAITEFALSINVEPKTIGIIWPQEDEAGNISFTYNEKEQVPKAVATGLIGSDICELTVEAENPVMPGTYTATVTNLSDSNYVLPEVVTKIYTIVTAEMADVIVNDVDEIYDNNWHSVKVDNAPVGAKFEFSTDGSNYSTHSPEFKEICSAVPVWYRISCPGYKTLEGKAYVTISENPLITKNPSIKLGMKYDGEEKELCSAAVGAEGIVVEYSLDKITWINSVPKAINAGQYRVYYRAKAPESTKYYVASLIAVISPSDVTVTWQNTEFNYDGTSKCPSPALSGILEGDTCNVSVSGAAVNAGTYTARIVDLNNTNYIVKQNVSTSFTINKAQAEFTAPTAIEGVIKDGQKKQIITPGSTSHGTMLYSLDSSDSSWSTALPTVTEAGNYTVSYRVDCDGNHYDDNPHSVNAKVYYGQAKAETMPKAYNPAYNGQGQALCSPAISTNGTALYSLDNENWSASVPEGINVGTYTVYWKIKGNELYLDSPVQSLEAKIEKAEITVTKDPEVISGLVYSGEHQELISAGEASGGRFVYACYNLGSGKTYEVPTGVLAGEYEITWYVEGDDNHKDTEYSTLKTTIAKASWPGIQSFSATNITYGDTLLASKFTNISGGKVVWKSPNLMPDSAGTKEYIAVFTPDDTANYKTEEIQISVTVNQRTAELQWDKETFEYDGTPKIPSASVMNTIGDDVCIVMAEGAGTDVGTYIATATGLGNSNYKLGTSGISFNYSIVPGDMNVHAEDVIKTYSPGGTNSYSIEVKGAPDGAKIYYSTDGTNYYTDNPVFEGKPGESVDEIVYYKVIHPNYNTTSGSARVFIYGGIMASAKEAPKAIANQYNGESHVLITAGEVTDANTMQLQYALKDENGTIGEFKTTIPEGTDARTYNVCYKIVSTQTGEVPDDERVYDSPVYELNAVITPMNIDVTWQRSADDTSNELTYVYDGKAHLPYAYGSAIDGSTLVAEIKGPSRTNPGNYQAEVTGFIGNKNYIASAETRKVNFEISKPPVGIEPMPDEGLIYNGLAQSLEIPGITSELVEEGKDSAENRQNIQDDGDINNGKLYIYLISGLACVIIGATATIVISKKRRRKR